MTTTLILLFISSLSLLNAEILVRQETSEKMVRWIIPMAQSDVSIDKQSQKVTLILENLERLAEYEVAVKQLKKVSGFIKDVEFFLPNENLNKPHLIVNLENPAVEAFNFYKQREGSHYLDFWLDKEKQKEQAAAIRPIPNEKPVAKAPVPVRAAPVAQAVVKKALSDTPQNFTTSAHKGYRDFRYGASFIWNAEPLAPEYAALIDLASKTPDYLYEIKNREILSDDKESHLQLTINLYKKGKWGLMYKSIKLYEEKFGEDSNFDINEYLKANAIIKENLVQGNRGPIKMAVNMLTAIEPRTKNYEMRRAIYKYLMAYHNSNKDFVNLLSVAKKFYVVSKENFDYEETPNSLETILYALAMLNQTAQIEELINEKTVEKIIPRQVYLAYKIYAYMKHGRSLDVLKVYEENKKTFTKPVHRLIVFNTAEAYFREARYEEAIKLYDEFISDYSFHTRSSDARLRLALSYEILDKDPAQTTELYRNTINRSSSDATRYEAQIRMVALTNVRKLKPTDKDKEFRVFLKNPFKNDDELPKDLKKLLWLTRLRLFIVDGEFANGMAYLQAIPTSAMKPAEVRTFEADGAEVVFGLIMDNYSKSDFSNVIRFQETYKDKYVNKVAMDPLVNFIVAKSYIRLGLFDGHDQLVKDFERIKNTPIRSFPIWIQRPETKSNKFLMGELEIIKNIRMKFWDKASNAIDSLTTLEENKKLDYYRTVVFYHLKNFDDAIKTAESLISTSGYDYLVDDGERAEFVNAYLDSLYETRKTDKFLKVLNALVEGRQNQGTYLDQILEKMEYLSIEVKSADKLAYSNFIRDRIGKFVVKYPKSIYEGRLKLLEGQTFLAEDRLEEANTVLTKILEDEKVAGHIKEMARSELSLVKIKQRNL